MSMPHPLSRTRIPVEAQPLGHHSAASSSSWPSSVPLESTHLATGTSTGSAPHHAPSAPHHAPSAGEAGPDGQSTAGMATPRKPAEHRDTHIPHFLSLPTQPQTITCSPDRPVEEERGPSTKQGPRGCSTSATEVHGGSSSSTATARSGPRSVPVADISEDVSALPISISIPSTEVERGLLGQVTVHYVVTTDSFGLIGLAKPTFEDFEALHATLSSRLKCTLPPLPQMYWYGNDSQSVTEERRLRLQGLLRYLMTLPDAIRDGEERLFRFLNMPKAARAATRFVSSPASIRSSWLQTLFETTSADASSVAPLQDPEVQSLLAITAEETLVLKQTEAQAAPQVASKVVVEKSAAALSERRRHEVALSCLLLARAHNSKSSPAEGFESTSVTLRARQVSTLLKCYIADQGLPACSPSCSDSSGTAAPSGGDRCIASAAAAALLTMAKRRSREDWAQTMEEFLKKHDGLAQLAKVADCPPTSEPSNAEQEADAMPDDAPRQAEWRGVEGRPDRLLAELLLRAFEDSFARSFGRSSVELGLHRKKILNLFFASEDPFVRTSLGLLMAKLLSVPFYEEAAQAGKGLYSLYQEFRIADVTRFRESGTVKILSEEPLLRWLCSLCNDERPEVAGYALLVMSEIVRPSAAMMLTIPNFVELLQEKAKDNQSFGVRAPAAQLLLKLQAHASRLPSFPGRGTSQGPVLESLRAALVATGEVSLQLRAEAQDQIAAEVRDVQSSCETVGRLQDSICRVSEGAGDLRRHIESWADRLLNCSSSCEMAAEARDLAATALTVQREDYERCAAEASRRSQVYEAPDSRSFESVDNGTRTEVSEDHIQECIETWRGLSDKRIWVTHRLAELDEALRSASASGEGSEESEVLRASVALREEAAELDEAMRQRASEAAGCDDAATSDLQAWLALQSQSRDSHTTLRAATAKVEEARSSLWRERELRRTLRSAARALAKDLALLDEELRALEAAEGDEDGSFEADLRS